MSFFEEARRKAERVGLPALIGGGIGGALFGGGGAATLGGLGAFKGAADVAGEGKGSGYDRDLAKNKEIMRERERLMNEGLNRGSTKAASLYGQSQSQTGADVQDVISRRREELGKKSAAAEAIRRKAQQDLRQSRSRRSSEAERRQISQDANQRASVQEQQDYWTNLDAFQKLIGNVANQQSSMELGYGNLGVASQYIAPQRPQQGMITGLTEGLFGGLL